MLSPDKSVRVRPLGLFSVSCFPLTPIFDLSLSSKVLAVAKFSWNQKVAEYSCLKEFKSLNIMLGFIRQDGIDSLRN